MAEPLAHARATSQPLAASRRRRVLAESAAWWAIRAIQTVAVWLPERLLGTAAEALGGFVFYVIRWRRRVACERIARALPHLSQTQQHQLARDSYVHIALALLWFLRQPRLIDLARLVEINAETKAQLNRLVAHDNHGARSRSAIVTAGHVGVWELLPPLLASSVLPSHMQWIVYRPLHNEKLNALVEQLRSGEQRHLLEDKSCFRMLHDALTSSTRPSLVGLVADQRSKNPTSRCQVRFLGQTTMLSTGAARLHLKTHSPLWFAAVIVNRSTSKTQQPGKPFKLILRPIMVQDGNDAAQQLTQSYAEVLEETVLAYPSQYLWIHDLWSQKGHMIIG